MATTKKQSASDILRQDHDKINKLFQKYELAEDSKEKETLASEIALQIKEHSLITESLIYPAAKEILEDEGVIEQCKEDDNAVKVVLAQLQRLYADVDKEEFEHKMQELRAAVLVYTQREERSLLSSIEKCDIDMDALGAEVLKLREGENVDSVKLQKKA